MTKPVLRRQELTASEAPPNGRLQIGILGAIKSESLGGFVGISSGSFAAALFKKADADSDGLLTEAELDAAKPKDAPAGAPSAADLIKAGDADGDGKLNQTELETALKATRPGASSDAGGSLAASLGQNATDSLSSLLESLLKALDDNKDGKIDKSDIDSLKKKAKEAAGAKASTDGSSQDSQSISESITVTIAQGANDNAGVTGYTGRTATLSFLLSFQETSAAA